MNITIVYDDPNAFGNNVIGIVGCLIVLVGLAMLVWYLGRSEA